MRNNDILRRLRYIFDYSDSQMVAIFELGGHKIDRGDVAEILKKEEESEDYTCSDVLLAAFLNGFIVNKRGKQDGVELIAEKKLSNNLILRKLKIGLNARDEEIMDILRLAGLRLSKHELSAFFRKKGHKNFRVCKDQVLRNFLTGMQKKYRGSASTTDKFSWS